MLEDENEQICHWVSEIKLMAFNSNFPRGGRAH